MLGKPIQKLQAYQLFKYCMKTRRSDWEEDKEFKAEQVRAMDLKRYNNLLTSGRWYNKDPKYYQMLDLGVVDQNIADDPKKSSDKSNKDPTKGDPDYTRNFPPWILEDPKEGSVLKTRTEKNICGARNTSLENSNGYVTSYKITVSGLVPHQSVKEALSHQTTDTETIIRPSLMDSRRDLYPSRTKVMYKNSCHSSA